MADDPRGPNAPTGQAQVPASDDLLEHLQRITLGEYDVAGELGRGGMATVYLAHDLSLDRKVAIKVMEPALLYGQGMAERFKREARTAAALSHPNIIPVYAVREAEGLLFFVMKLIQGTPLDAVIRELGPLPIPMVEALLGQVGGALGYAHRQGVVHRDVKPANILIDEEGWAVVSDFGIAKVAEAEGLTLTGMAVGTPSYMSPEQCLGGEVGGSSDQYALGCVAFEMLTGRPPFTGPTQMALMYSHCHDTLPPLASARPECPESLRVTVERMLSKEPADRWPTLEEAVGAIGIKTLAHDDPTRHQLVSLARTGLTHKLVRAVQTPRSPVPLTKSRQTVPPVEESQSTPTARSRSSLWIGGLAAGVALTLGLVAVLGRGDRLGGAPSAEPAGPQPVEVPVAEVPAGAVPSLATKSSAGGSAVLSVVPAPGRQAVQQPPPASSDPSLQNPETQKATTDPAVAPPVVVPPASPESVVTQTPVTGSPAADPKSQPPPPPVVSLTPVPSNAEVLSGLLGRYTDALEAGDVASALTVFPEMPRDQRGGLEAFARQQARGATLRAEWTLRDLEVNGTSAIGRVVGTTTLRRPGEDPSTTPVNLRIRFERRASSWIITALVN